MRPDVSIGGDVERRDIANLGLRPFLLVEDVLASSMHPLREENSLLLTNSTARDFRVVLNPWVSDIVLPWRDTMLVSQLAFATEPFEFDFTEDVVFMFFGSSADLKIRHQERSWSFVQDESTGWRGPTPIEHTPLTLSLGQTRCFFRVPGKAESGKEIIVFDQLGSWDVRHRCPNPLLDEIEAVVDPGYSPVLRINDASIEVFPQAAGAEESMS
ncbi:hypothetical protein [Prauserella halophila]|uniref:hypothetical protein n=1 Tax=Prauserella halophila TaxID=185641 RepID=UPI0020A4AF08|nr:hypothetical protein [Prauserella halophila]